MLGTAAPAAVAVVVALSGCGGGTSHPRVAAGQATSRVPAPTPARPRDRERGRPPGAVRLGAIPPPRPGRARVYDRGPVARREVAITFDDGFCAACARRIVDYLARSGERATIFPNGVYASSWDPLASRIRALVARGQLTVGNHTFHHVDAPGVGRTVFGEDLSRNERWIERTFRVTARPFFRPPYGAYNSGTLAEAGAQGYTHVIMWSGTLADSSPRSIPYVLNAIRIWAKPGAIILCHANYPATAEALPRIFAILRRKHLRPVTLAQLLGHSSGGRAGR